MNAAELVPVIDAALPELAHRYERLGVVAGAPNSGRTSLFRTLATRPGRTLVSLNAALARRLLDVAPARRAMAVPALLESLLPSPSPDVTLLDDIELLFLPDLGQPGLSPLRQFARTRTLLVSWTLGATTTAERLALDSQTLTYAVPGHPEYRTERLDGPIWCIRP